MIVRNIVCMTFIFYASLGLTHPTKIQYYRPFGAGTEQTHVQMVVVKKGHCWSQSKRIVREDAWRCVAESKTYDPCFVHPYRQHDEAICIETPWSSTSVLMHLDTPVNPSTQNQLDVSTSLPWAVELVTHEYCIASERHERIEGLPVHYRCTDHSVLFGYLQHCKEEWSILRKKVDQPVDTVVIKRAWY